MQVSQVHDIEHHLLPGTVRMMPEQVDQTVLSKRMWICRSLAEWRELNGGRVNREGAAASRSCIWAAATGWSWWLSKTGR